MRIDGEQICDILGVDGYDEDDLRRIVPFEDFCESFEMCLRNHLDNCSGYYYGIDTKSDKEVYESHIEERLYYLEVYLDFTHNPKDYYKAYLTEISEIIIFREISKIKD